MTQNKRQKLIIIEDDVQRYGEMHIDYKEQIISPFASIYPKKKEEPFFPGRVDIFNKSLFDSDNIMVIRQNIGLKGVISLILRRGYYLKGLFISPFDVSVDLTANSKENLVYQFYNHSNQDEIEISAIMAEDVIGVASDIILHEDDISLRQFFVIKAKENYPKLHPEINGNIWEMEIKQASRYLEVSVKTLYNYNTKKIIPYTKKAGIIKYKKSDLDFFISHKK